MKIDDTHEAEAWRRQRADQLFGEEDVEPWFIRQARAGRTISDEDLEAAMLPAKDFSQEQVLPDHVPRVEPAPPQAYEQRRDGLRPRTVGFFGVGALVLILLAFALGWFVRDRRAAVPVVAAPASMPLAAAPPPAIIPVPPARTATQPPAPVAVAPRPIYKPAPVKAKVPSAKPVVKAKPAAKAKADARAKDTGKVKATIRDKASAKQKASAKDKASAKQKASIKQKAGTREKASAKPKASAKKAVAKVRPVPKSRSAPKAERATSTKPAKSQPAADRQATSSLAPDPSSTRFETAHSAMPEVRRSSPGPASREESAADDLPAPVARNAEKPRRSWRATLPICKGFQTYRPTTPCRIS